jgi:hypothetical protein
MKRLLSVSLLALCLPATAGQIDQLSPDCREAGGFAVPIEAAFHKAIVGQPVIGVTVLPSFDVEWGIRVTRQSDGTYSLHYLTFAESVLHVPQAGQSGFVAPAPSTKTVMISVELARQLHDLVSNAINAAQKQDSGYDVLDGTDYLFRVNGQTCAEIANPPAKSQPASLVQLIYALRDLAIAPVSEQKRRERQILHRIQSLSWRSPALQPAQNRS